jgi:hypothetical protein
MIVLKFIPADYFITIPSISLKSSKLKNVCANGLFFKIYNYFYELNNRMYPSINAFTFVGKTDCL